MSSTATVTTGGARADHSPASAFTSVLDTAVGVAAAKLEQKVGAWIDKFSDVAGRAVLEDNDELTQGMDAKQRAGAEAVKAGLRGKNPIWAAIKGAWKAGTPVVRAAIIAAVVSAILLLLLSPVLLLVFLLSLLIIAAVHRSRRAKP